MYWEWWGPFDDCLIKQTFLLMILLFEICMSFMNNVKKLSVEKSMLKRKVVNCQLDFAVWARCQSDNEMEFVVLIKERILFVWLFCCELIVMRLFRCLLIRSFLISFPEQNFCEFSFWCWVFHHRLSFYLLSEIF